MKHITLVSAFLVSSVFGQSTDVLTTAQSLLDQGKFTESADLLKAQSDTLKNNAQYHFLYGQAALQARRPQVAKQQFETMLAGNPNLSRVKLDLALAEEQLGNFDRAKQLYQEVLTSNPPANVQANIQQKIQLLSQVEKRGVEKRVVTNAQGEQQVIQQVKEKKWTADLSAGVFFDSNVNAGPDTDTISIFNLPFVLDDNAKGQEDWGFQVKANFRYTHQWNDQWSSFGTLRYQRTQYDENDRFDFDQIGFSVGATYKGKNYALTLPLDYTINFLGGDLYTQSYGISPQLQYQMSQQWTSSTALSIASNSNDQAGNRTGESYSISQSFQWTAKSGQWSLVPRIYYAREEARVNFLSSNQFGASLGLNMNIGEKWSAFIEPGIRYTKYLADEPLFSDTREEPQFTFTANLTRELPWWDLDAVLGYTFNYNNANLDLYEYERHQVSLLFRKEF